MINIRFFILLFTSEQENCKNLVGE